MSDILNCGQGKLESELVRFSYQCPKYWDNLQATKNNSIRFCDACQENVFYCTDKQEAEQHALQGHCIAIARNLTAAVDKQYEKPQPPVMGIPKLITRPEHNKAWAKDIFDHQKHQLVKAIRDYASRTGKADRIITVTKIDYRDLSHVDLSGVDLSYADLSDVNLFNTNLSGANLSHANLRGANLVKTKQIKDAIALSKERKNSVNLCIGKLYLEQGEKQKAIEYYEGGIVAVKELRIQTKRNRPYCLENLDSDRKRLLKIIDRFKDHSDKTLNLSPYSQKLLQDRESDRLEIEQLIDKITTVLIMVRYT